MHKMSFLFYSIPLIAIPQCSCDTARAEHISGTLCVTYFTCCPHSKVNKCCGHSRGHLMLTEHSQRNFLTLIISRDLGANRNEKCLQNFGRNKRNKEATWEIYSTFRRVVCSIEGNCRQTWCENLDVDILKSSFHWLLTNHLLFMEDLLRWIWFCIRFVTSPFHAVGK